MLLIEQFATVALGLANRAYVMEGGRIQFSGAARELRENPELLHSAYLLRGSNGVGRDAGGRRRRMSAGLSVSRAGARARALRRHRARTRVLRDVRSGCDAGDRPPLAFPGHWLYAGATPCVHIADSATPTSPTHAGSACR